MFSVQSQYMHSSSGAEKNEEEVVILSLNVWSFVCIQQNIAARTQDYVLSYGLQPTIGFVLALDTQPHEHEMLCSSTFIACTCSTEGSREHPDYATGFYGVPVMLEDGSVVDSARLPADAIQEYPVTISAANLLQTARSEQRFEHQPMTYSSSSTAASSAHLAKLQAEASRLQPQPQPHELHYHPVHVSDPTSLAGSDAVAGMQINFLRCLTFSSSTSAISS